MRLLWLSLLCVAGIQAAEYRIAGTVVNSVTGAPIKGVQLVLSPAGHPDEEVRAVSGAEGQFLFSALPQGQYRLTGQRRGYIEQSYGLHPPAATSIVTGEGQDTEHIVFQFAPPAVIGGKVVDEEGDPVEHATVELLNAKVRDGKRHAALFATATTNDIGEYRFSAVPPGLYYVTVAGYPWYTKFNEIVLGEPSASPIRAGFGVKYYPDVTDPSSADTMNIRPGMEAVANFSMVPVPSVTVNVSCDGAEIGNKEYRLTTAGLGGNRLTVRQGTDAGDSFTLWSVPPGHYVLQADLADANPKLFARREIDVGTEDTEVTLEFKPAPAITGTLEVEGGSLPQNWTPVLYDEDTGRAVSGLPAGGARFSFPGIPPGRYRVGFSGPEEYYLKNWSVTGARSTGGVMDVAEGASAHLRMLVSKGAARIEGRVYRGDQTVPGALVVLAPSGASAKPEDYRAYSADSDGSYHFAGVPLGDYAIFAVESNADLEYANPTAIQPYLASSHKVHIAQAGKRSERVEIASPGGHPQPEPTK